MAEIGIDLGTDTIKMSVVKEDNGIYEIKHSATYLLDTEMDYNVQLKNFIKDFTKENKISSANISFTIPQNNESFVTRFIKLPNINTKEIEKGIKYEIEERTPLADVGSAYYKYGVTEKNEEEVSVLAVMIDKEVIQKLKKLGNLKWKIKNIEPQIITLGRAIEGNTIVIDMGHANTRIYAYKEGNPYSQNIINVGGKQVTKRIEESYFSNDTQSDKKRYESSREMKNNTCFLTREAYNIFEGDIETSEIIREDLMQLASEIKRNIRSIEIKDNLQIEHIYITGRPATYFTEYISEELGYNVEYLELGEDSTHTAASLASIYKTGYSKTFNYATINTVKLNYSNILVGVITASIMLNLGVMNIHKKYDAITSDLQIQVEEQNTMISQMDSEMESGNSQIMSYETLKGTLEGINNARRWFSDILYVLPEQTPLGVVITRMQINDGSVVMEGLSEDYGKIGFLAIGLEKYGDVVIESIDNNVDKEIYTNNNDILDLTLKMNKAFKITMNHGGNLIDRSE